LKCLFRQNKLSFHGSLRPLAQPKLFRAWLRQLWRKEWVVYAKQPFGGPQHVLQYLARYTHRVAISNHRLISFEDGLVTFRWRDYAHGNKKRKMTLSAEEFLRRFLLHVLPRGFTRIRHFGLFANRRRRAAVALCRVLLGHEPTASAHPGVSSAVEWKCPNCTGPMIVLEKLTAVQIGLRSTALASFVDTS
jgi:hypothetical protein